KDLSHARSDRNDDWLRAALRRSPGDLTAGEIHVAAVERQHVAEPLSAVEQDLDLRQLVAEVRQERLLSRRSQAPAIAREIFEGFVVEEGGENRLPFSGLDERRPRAA